MPRDNLLKEALADARKIKEIAVENARLQLEDQLKPQLSSIISESLRAQLEEDTNPSSSGIGGSSVNVKDPSPTNPAKGANSSSNIPNPDQEIEAMGDGDPQKAPLKERLAMGKGDPHKKPLKEFDVPVPGEEEDEFGLGGAPGAGAPTVPGAAAPAPSPAGAMGGAPQLDIDISPDGQGGEEFDLGMGGAPAGGDELDLEAIIRELEAESQGGAPQPAMESFDEAEAGKEVDGAFDGSVNETLAGKSGDGEFHDGKSPSAVDGVNGGKKVSPGQSVTGSKAETMSEEIDLEEILREMEAEEGSSVEESEQIATENVELKRSLREHREVIQYLRTKLHEVNMLNSKLLYTTKLFRAFNLNEGQKNKIVDTFDRAATLREVKLVYATLAESFVGNKGTKKSATVVAEGLASKPIGSTKPKSEQILEEGNTLVSRMQKLAGIKTQN